ncbi:hypothetical protein Cme02nite_60460 [Catellatospora methionotrophica]|uniref:Uncharacterized protein n=1 Tax=Catellatospora methionotrophica TaxID=121620 RepID=A0A8J3LFC7_9ACTN|nr:hypothetical protein [Catellatospora methionotrophica]GIG17714.1 hypothetical protein Cme02nite_60460 [Catellatospora methionotrophica]
MTDTIGGKYTLLDAGRAGRLGTWHTVSTAEGKQRGALRLEDRGLTDPAAAQRLADAVSGQARLRVPGLLNVIDQVTEGRHSWLITNAAPSPTVAQALAAGVTLPPAVAALIATDTAQTLLKLHSGQLAHGELNAHGVVISAGGAALLAEAGYGHAVLGTTPGPGHDAAGWSRLLAQLADACHDAVTQQLLRQAGQQAEAVGGSAGITAALTTLSGAAQQITGFGDRAALKSLAARMHPLATTPVSASPMSAPPVSAPPVSAPPVAAPPVSGPPAFPAQQPWAAAPAFPPGAPAGVPAAEETVQLAGGSHSGPPPQPPRTAPPTAVMPVVPPDGATRMGNRAAEEQRKSGAYQVGRAAPPQAQQPQQDVNLRFGQGVPPAPPAWQMAAAQAAPPPRPRKTVGKRIAAFFSALTTVALLVIAGYVGWNWWQERNNAVQVTKVTVTPVVPPTTAECNVNVDVVGLIETDGQAGVITYEWLRNDGETSGALEQAVKDGTRSVQVHLFWRFQGKGTREAEATLRILKPTVIQGSSKFTYSCK